MRLVSERLQRQDLDHAPYPAAFFRRMQEALQQSRGVVNGTIHPLALIPGDEHSRQRHVLELVQVAEIVVDGQASFTRPLQRFGHPTLRSPDPGLQSRYGARVRQGRPDEQALSLVQQAESALQIALCLVEPSLGNTPAAPPYRQLRLLAQFLASQQVFCGSSQVTPFKVQLTQPPIQVSRFRRQRLALVHHDLQQPL